ncbi:CheR family methyltransferase [Deferribacter abyssi]|uniref:CheR family methyltransferase n=1 Tax=Deferribacter abyssi TaxID=213806 RepID=UPI003C1460CF
MIEDLEIVNKILEILYQHKKIDFTRYKLNTIIRRISHRLIALGFKNIMSYYNYLLDNLDTEVDALANIILINTSEFFRDPLYFYIFDNLVNTLTKKGCDYIKVLSVGCSSGEEVYTLLMILNEYREKNPNFNYKIVGIDIDHDAVMDALEAVYNKNSLTNVPLKFIEKYFINQNDKFIFNKQLIPNESITFINENFLDTNCSKIIGVFKYNFIFCRNLLIYLDKAAQKTLIKKFIDILAVDSYLFLGKSEYIDKKYTNRFKELFEGVKVYKFIYEG